MYLYMKINLIEKNLLCQKYLSYYLFKPLKNKYNSLKTSSFVSIFLYKILFLAKILLKLFILDNLFLLYSFIFSLSFNEIFKKSLLYQRDKSKSILIKLFSKLSKIFI